MHHARRLLAVALLFGPASLCWAGQAPPRISCEAGGECVLSRLPPLLSGSEVRGYLRSGLTTTLALSVSAKGENGRRLAATARIDVRFEPWEEVFFVELSRTGFTANGARLISEEALRRHWADLRLELPLGERPKGRVSVELNLFPFSEDDEADTRRSYAETLRAERLRPAVTDEGKEAKGNDGPDLVGELLDTLTLTSIKRHGVRRLSWSVPIADEP
jgi:hypothetical protein